MWPTARYTSWLLCIALQLTAFIQVLQALSSQGVQLILLRCAGFNNVDLDAAAELKLTVLRVVRILGFINISLSAVLRSRPTRRTRSRSTPSA